MDRRVALVFGAGAFGTCIAKVIAENFDQVILKVRSQDVYDSIINDKENAVYLPGLKLPEQVKAIIDWKELSDQENRDIDLVVSGLPTAAIAPFFKENHERIEDYLDRGIPLVSLSKGIDPDTLELSDDYFYDLFPKHRDQFLFLSGPSFAKEIMQEHITLVTLAGRSKKNLTVVSSMLETPFFKALPSYDVKGVLLGGALKNVIAIAGGIIEGLGFNHNTRAAMITRGINEMNRFGKVLNARPETFYGLSGMGDLILTTTGGLSRNKNFGLELAKGRKPLEIIESQRSVVEGYKTARAAHLLSEKYEIRANIFNSLYQVLYHEADPKAVIQKLMQMPTRFEMD